MVQEFTSEGDLETQPILVLLDMVQKLEKRVSDLENRYEVNRLSTPCRDS